MQMYQMGVLLSFVQMQMKQIRPPWLFVQIQITRCVI